MSAVIYELPRSFCLESWAAALFMAGAVNLLPELASALLWRVGNEGRVVREEGEVLRVGAFLSRSLAPACWLGLGSN